MEEGTKGTFQIVKAVEKEGVARIGFALYFVAT